MAKKDIRVIQGDSYDLGFRVTGAAGPFNFAAPGTVLTAQVTDVAGTRAVRSFVIQERNFSQGSFVIHLDPEDTNVLRGKYSWFCKYQNGNRVITLAYGTLTSIRAA